MAKPPTTSSPTTNSPSTNKPPPSTKQSTNHPPTNAAAQFHRFRLSEFTRDTPSSSSSATGGTTSAPAGQCSRFRVSDFVPSPWTSDTPTAAAAAASVALPVASPPSPVNMAAPRQGSFSVMHMDVDGGGGPQQTSSSVAAAAGSGRGVLQKVAVVVTQGGQKGGGVSTAPRPLAPSPLPVLPVVSKPGFDPSTVPQEAVWELSRIMTIFRQLPPLTIVNAIQDAMMKWPSLNEGSLLRRIGEVFPPLPPQPMPQPPPAPEQVRKKRGRPPGKKTKLNDGTAAPVPIAASPIGLAAMAPPPAPLPYPQPVLAPAPPAAMTAPLTVRGKNVPDKLVSCTRCLKPFNPTWRATPASDPSSEATCAVKHPYKGFEAGLEAVTLPRRKNNYKTTWKWKCCGREVQSTSEQLLMWPRKEDDRTGGWCFVGKHTTEPGVREKLGLKPGKGKKISEEIGRKRKKGVEVKEVNGGAVVVDASKAWALSESVELAAAVQNGGLQVVYGLPPQQQQQQSPPSAYPQTDSTPNSDDPPKRKRGRPKGSKTRSKIMQMTIPGATTKESTAPNAPLGHRGNTGPEQQLMNEASQQHLPAHGVVNPDTDIVQDQNSFWTQYTEPNLEIEPVDEEDDNDDEEEDEEEDHDGDGDEDEEDDDNQDASPDGGEDPAISSADLTLLASATAAMSAPQHQILPEEAPEKRKRGRPKGSRNGKMPVETTQKALRMKPVAAAVVKNVPPVVVVPVVGKVPVPVPVAVVPDPVVIGTDEGAPFVGMGGMDYGGLGGGDGGGWFG